MLIQEAKSMIATCIIDCSICYANRVCNSAARELAKFGSYLRCSSSCNIPAVCVTDSRPSMFYTGIQGRKERKRSFRREKTNRKKKKEGKGEMETERRRPGPCCSVKAHALSACRPLLWVALGTSLSGPALKGPRHL